MKNEILGKSHFYYIIYIQLLSSVRLADVDNRHVADASLDFGQRKDVFHQLGHFGACEILELWGKALNSTPPRLQRRWVRLQRLPFS